MAESFSTLKCMRLVLGKRLIGRRIIVASGWGYVSYGLPYLDWYFKRLPEPAPRTDAWVM